MLSNKLQTIDTVQKWSAAFGGFDHHVIVQNAEFINNHKQSVLPAFMVALKSISLSIPSPESQIVHLRNYFLEAIGKGWTWNNPHTEINGIQFGIDEAILAVSSYFCHAHMPMLDGNFLVL